MSPEAILLDRLLEISELFQKDMARAFDGTPLTPARVRLQARSTWRYWARNGVNPGRRPMPGGRQQAWNGS